MDQHHTVEDVGIALGEAVKQALGSKRGILRAGYFLMPMDDCLAAAALDFSGRAYCVCNYKISAARVGDFQTELMEDFFRAFAQAAAANVHLKLMYGRSSHHQVEVDFQGVREGAAFRGHARQAAAPRAAVDEGTAVKIAIVDYGAGNLPSVERALRKLGAETERAVEPEQVAAAKAIVLPGVGHFSRVRRRPARAQPHRFAARRVRFRRADSRHLPRPAGDVRVERRSAGRTRASDFSPRKCARSRRT